MVVRSRSLPRHVTKLTWIHSYENLNKTDVVISSSEAKDL